MLGDEKGRDHGHCLVPPMGAYCLNPVPGINDVAVASREEGTEGPYH